MKAYHGFIIWLVAIIVLVSIVKPEFINLLMFRVFQTFVQLIIVFGILFIAIRLILFRK